MIASEFLRLDQVYHRWYDNDTRANVASNLEGEPMTPEALQKALCERPFNPLVLHVDNGATYVVPMPRYAAHKPGSRTAVVLNLNDEGMNWIDLAHVTKVTFARPPVDPGE
jgi:hypothetical protein